MFAFDATVRPSELGLSAEYGSAVYIGATTMPMSHKNAMGLVQYIHRRMLATSEAAEAEQGAGALMNLSLNSPSTQLAIATALVALLGVGTAEAQV